MYSFLGGILQVICSLCDTEQEVSGLTLFSVVTVVQLSGASPFSQRYIDFDASVC